ncbi:transposase IS200-family protein [Leptolyngbya sp. NIES-3755]|nr:transposase IS200-family protein [Leptolyngbya sp. NIES-3755]
MAKQEYRSGAHCIYSIQLHSYFVCKYRRKALTPEMISRVREVIEFICHKRNCILLEFGGEADHVHLLIDLHPDNNISAFFGSLKSATSRILRSEFPDKVNKFYRTGFWGRQKYYRSAGGAPLNVLMQYIDAHPHD